MKPTTSVHEVLLEETNFSHVLKHIHPQDIPSCLQVCKFWYNYILRHCSLKSSFSLKNPCRVTEEYQMEHRMSRFISKHSKKKYNFKMTIISTRNNVTPPSLIYQIVPKFAFSLYRLQLCLNVTPFGGYDEEVMLRKFLSTLISLTELEVNRPFFTLRLSDYIIDIRSAFDVVLTPPFSMPSLRKLVWREQLYLHKSDYLPIAFPNSTVCVLSLVTISPFLGPICFYNIWNVTDIPNPPYPTSGEPLGISWTSLKKLTVEGADRVYSKFQWLSHICPQTHISQISFSNVTFGETLKDSHMISKFLSSHSCHVFDLKLTRSDSYSDPFRSLYSIIPQDFLADCDFPSLLNLECEVTFLGNVSTALSKMPSLQKIHLSTSSPKPILSIIISEHDNSESCDYCAHLWSDFFSVQNNVKHLALMGNYCVKSLRNFATVLTHLESLEIEERSGNLEIICEAFANINFLKMISVPL